MHQGSTCYKVVSTVLVHHADPLGVSEPHSVCMMLECSTGESLARPAGIHPDDQGHDALRYHVVLKWLSNPENLSCLWVENIPFKTRPSVPHLMN